jgi:hypothetical protein
LATIVALRHRGFPAIALPRRLDGVERNAMPTSFFGPGTLEISNVLDAGV